jgi:benzylsuccinate CoA-transferase BbsF subunit
VDLVSRLRLGGLNAIQGNAGDPPVRTGSGIFADQLSGMYATLAIVAALEARQRTGEGRFIDLSMAECVTQMLGPSVLEAARDGQLPPRVGNRDLPFAPHGVYPCSGDDEWLALSILDDTHWQALVDLVDDERLRAADLADNAGRTRARATIDGVLSAWTSGFDKRDLAVLLQSVGIAAGPVNTVSDLLFDPHLAARQAFQPVEHAQPMLGYLAHPHPAAAWTAVGRRRATSTDIRANGADNYRVLHAWLGLSRAEVTRLVRGGALTCSGPFRVDEAPDAPEMPRDPTFATRLALATQDR